MKSSGIGNRIRRIWAIAVNDFIDGIKNRKLMTNTITIVFLILLYRFLPVLGSGSDPTRLILLDEGTSMIVQGLERSDEVRFIEVESYEDLVYKVGIEDIHTVGVALPADFDQRASGSESVEIKAIVDHWVSDEDIEYMQADLEPELSRLAGIPVQVNMVREVITQAESAYSFHIGLLLLITLGLMGMMFTTHMLILEKESRTLDTLQVSPATMTDVLIAKGFVGGVYSLVMAIVVLAAYWQFILHWWAMLVALLVGTFVFVSIGLLLGVAMKDSRQAGLWGFIIFQPLIISMIVGMFEPIAEPVRAAMRWTPTVALGHAAAQSITATVDIGAFALALLVMVVWGVAFFAPASWLQHREA